MSGAGDRFQIWISSIHEQRALRREAAQPAAPILPELVEVVGAHLIDDDDDRKAWCTLCGGERNEEKRDEDGESERNRGVPHERILHQRQRVDAVLRRVDRSGDGTRSRGVRFVHLPEVHVV